MINRITDIIPRPGRDFVYKVLASLPGKTLCVDVGAAAGLTTRQIRTTGGAAMEVVAFEPFPDNARLFVQQTRDLTNVRLVTKAVGHLQGQADFLVPQVVNGSERDWEEFGGYSSVGFLVDWPSLRDWTRDFRRALRNVVKIAHGRLSPKGHQLPVQVTTLDAEFAGRTIDFLKIDVQGGEDKVLVGANNLLTTGAIPLIYLEWNGHRATIELLEDHGYRVFDSTYAVFPRGTPLSDFERLGLERIGDLHLSSGQDAYEMILNGGNLTPEQVVSQARAMGFAGIQTDLIAVLPSRLPEFLSAIRSLAATAVTN